VPEGAFAIGLQIDRHVTRAVAVDLVGSVLVRDEAGLPPGGPSNGTKVILDLVASVRSKLAGIVQQSEKRLVGLGAAMPGPFGVAGSGDDPWMMEAWQKFPLLETLTAGTGLDVGLQNDAAAAATAERMVGAAHGLDHAVCLFVGYGIGAGLILNGELYRGTNGNAGEIGMALLFADGRSTPLEHRASLASLYQHLSVDPADPHLHAHINDLALRGDQSIHAWVEAAAVDLRWSIHLIETLFDPQTVILCGSAGSAGEQVDCGNRAVAALDRRTSWPDAAAPAARHGRSLVGGAWRCRRTDQPCIRSAFCGDPQGFPSILRPKP
jgi:predicted NBD/HSP70 family sugar kinase